MHANEYVVCSPDDFATRIEDYSNSMDAVISSHNLEHCNDPGAVLRAMIHALKPGGMIYLAFPCEASVNFPKRGGCLNFFDDSTHAEVPNWSRTLQTLSEQGCDFVYVAKRYRPFPLWLKGLILEPASYFRKHVAAHGATWALYGFESIIWARKQPLNVVVKDWGAKKTQSGEGVNVQPDGSSAIWIQLQDFVPTDAVHVEFAGRRGERAATVTGDLVTAQIPETVIHRPGEYPVEIVDVSGKRIPVGSFVVD